MSKAYDEGVHDKLCGDLEPEPQYDPGTKKYSDYVDGYLNTPGPEFYYQSTGDHHVHF